MVQALSVLAVTFGSLATHAILATLATATIFTSGCGEGEGAASFHGVKLGMAPRDVRDRFDAASLGSFKVTPGDEMLLDWAPADGARTTVSSARFEFHSGMLVAVRASLAAADPDAPGAPLVVTKTSVAARAGDEHVSYTLLVRDCPTHKDEEKRLLGKGP